MLKLSERTIKALGKIVTGDERLSPYRGGPSLVSLFNELGLNDLYGQGFPSRWAYSEESIRKINGKPELFLLDSGDTLFNSGEISKVSPEFPDVIEVLTGSDRPRKYWSDLKKKLASGGYVEVSDKIRQLKIELIILNRGY